MDATHAVMWQDVKSAIDAENQRILFDPPPEIVRLFKYGISQSGAGTNGQAFTTMVFTEGDCRYLAFYGSNNVVRLCDDPDMSLEALKAVARVFLPLSSEFLAYCGLKNLYAFVLDTIAALDSVKTKDQFRELITSVTLYAGTLNSWIQHYFPWNIGVLFPQRDAEAVEEMGRLLKT